jgi:hypothetical protein
LVIRALHLGVVAVDMLAAEPEELLVVLRFEAVATRTVDERMPPPFVVSSLRLRSLD